MHLDTCSLLIDKKNLSKYSKCEINNHIEVNEEQTYVETYQNKDILNSNYSLYDTDLDNSLKICNVKFKDMLNEECYFLKVKQNYKNEIILWNASKYLHYKPNNFVNISIRGDMRILPKKCYDINLYKKYRGPRYNMQVSFCSSEDKEKIKDNEVKYYVFK